MAGISAFSAFLVGLEVTMPWTRSSWPGLRRRRRLMAGVVVVLGNDHDPTQEAGRRGEGDLSEFEAPAYALDEPQPLRCLHKALGTQRPETTQALAEHVGLDPMFHADFLRAERLVLMRCRFCVRRAALGAQPRWFWRKQHCGVDLALDRLHDGGIRSEVT